MKGHDHRNDTYGRTDPHLKLLRQALLSSEPTESVHAIIEVYVDHRFADLDRTLDKSAAVVDGSIADGKPSTVNTLQITSWRIS